MRVSPSPSRRKKALRPDPCRVCGAPSWWDGGRLVAEVVQELGQGVRCVIDVLRPRARCSDRRCVAGSWTIYSADAYPHRSYQLDVVASAVAEVYVGGASRQATAGHHACSRRSVARWVRWTAQLARVPVRNLHRPTVEIARRSVRTSGPRPRLVEYDQDRRGMAAEDWSVECPFHSAW